VKASGGKNVFTCMCAKLVIDACEIKGKQKTNKLKQTNNSYSTQKGLDTTNKKIEVKV
jgi:hypothetical protein